MTTRRLYYEDSYLTQFDAIVTACEKTEQGFKVSLDRSAFYPTSGGQPYDTGSINGSKVLDVYTDEQKELWHIIDQDIPLAAPVHCKIDWPRRFDHMQQHGGEHILAGALSDLFGGFTHGLHIGEDISTIDVTMPDGRTRLDDDDNLQLENLANSRVQQAAPIRAWFPNPDELNKLPLRKEPTVSNRVRIIQIGEFEMVACGGTHPKNTGEIGLIKILSTAPARGKLRIYFLCGKRALLHYHTLIRQSDGASSALSVPAEDISAAVQKLLDERTALKEEIKRSHKEKSFEKAQDLLFSAVPMTNGDRLVTAQLDDPGELKSMASFLVSKDSVIALLSAPHKGQGLRILFARSQNLKVDMAGLMKLLGVKGGGQADYAQGSTVNLNILHKAAELLKELELKE